MPAARPTDVLELLSGGPSNEPPIIIRNLPSRVNSSSMRSVGPLPDSHTLSSSSTKIPCSLAGQTHAGATHLLGSSGPPQAWSRLPSASNSMTDGAGLQQSERGLVRVGGLGTAPFSSAFTRR